MLTTFIAQKEAEREDHLGSLNSGVVDVYSRRNGGEEGSHSGEGRMRSHPKEGILSLLI